MSRNVTIYLFGSCHIKSVETGSERVRVQILLLLWRPSLMTSFYQKTESNVKCCEVEPSVFMLFLNSNVRVYYISQSVLE